MAAALPPFVLRPVLVEKPWGGRRLVSYGKNLPPDLMIGESWEVADLPDHVAHDAEQPQSIVASGPLAGRSLRSVIEVAGNELLGPVAPTDEGRFPLLVKLLDAREHLSVQVHPHEGYVAEHPDARLKTESWYVVGAEPGSVLFHGICADSDFAEVKAAIGKPEIVPHMHDIAAVPGSFHHVPAGLLHSLGAGVMVAEVQTPSDTTFRLYDWAEEYGRAPRQMHFAEGAASLVKDPVGAVSIPVATAAGTRDLISNEHYWMREHRQSGGELELLGAPGPAILMVMEGSVSVGDLALTMGSTVMIPASAIPSTRVGGDADAVVLEIGLGV